MVRSVMGLGWGVGRGQGTQGAGEGFHSKGTSIKGSRSKGISLAAVWTWWQESEPRSPEGRLGRDRGKRGGGDIREDRLWE